MAEAIMSDPPQFWRPGETPTAVDNHLRATAYLTRVLTASVQDVRPDLPMLWQRSWRNAAATQVLVS
jgi:hypothetical protein